MLIIAFICLLLVCLITSTFYSIYSNKFTVINWAVKISALLSCCILAIVTANLTSAIGGYSIFVIIGLIFLLAGEFFNLSNFEKTSVYFYFKNITLALGFTCFFVSGLIYGDFNIFALLCGVFIATGLICLNFALKRQEKAKAEIISQSILISILSLFLSQGISLLLGTHLLTGLFFLVGGIFALAGTMAKALKKQGDNIARIIANALYILGLIAISTSIYFI